MRLTMLGTGNALATECYNTCFVIEDKADSDLMIRECVRRKNIQRPRTLTLLDTSRNYWMARGVEDWGIVIDSEKKCFAAGWKRVNTSSGCSW